MRVNDIGEVFQNINWTSKWTGVSWEVIAFAEIQGNNNDGM